MHKKPLLLLALIVAALFGLYYLKYFLGYASDLRTRPWAYSRDPDAKLLVGKWRGQFTDPAGVAKRIALEIDLPVTEKERERNASRRTRRKMKFKDKQAFGGRAVVTSRLGEERYELWGAVGKEDMHLLKMHFRSEDEAPPILPNQALFEAPSGRWEGDLLEIALTFTPLDARGGSSSTSKGVVVNGQLVWEESPADRPTAVPLSRSAP